MYPFFESIKLENKKVFHLEWHQRRVNETFLKFFPDLKPLDLMKVVKSNVSNKTNLQKIKIYYDDMNYEIEIQDYKRRRISSFELIPIDFNYEYKFTNRENFQNIINQSESDQVIFTKNDFLLDSIIANLAFFDGSQWFTPNTYLLNGTTRQRLIYENKLHEIPIKSTEIKNFDKISFINALNDLDENVFNL